MGKIKSFFKKVGLWFKNHAPTKRRLIQVYAALLFNANIKGFFSKGTNVIYRGSTKYLCSPGLNCYSCPGAVAACPLGALQNSLASADKSAPFYIIGILALLGLIFARTICGFLCPVGLGQELLYKIKTPKLKKSRYTQILSYFKYVLLVVFVIAIPLIYNTIPAFCKYICPAGTFASVGQLSNPNNTDFFSMLGYLFSWKFILLVVFIVGSVFIYRFFCRFFCPLGAIYGFFNRISLLGVKLEKQKCIDCGMCVQTCLMDIREVGDHECINCGACISVCPTKAISWKGSKIFLHTTSPVGTVSDEPVKAPLSAMLASGKTDADVTVKNSVIENNSVICAAEINAAESENNAVKSDLTDSAVFESFEEIKSNELKDSALTSDTSSGYDAVAEKIKKRGFWLQFGAWILALAVLIFALVYYNFIASTDSVTVYGVGDRCPDITLSVFDDAGAYNDDGTKIEYFSTLESRGTVTVINFWYTTCGPCVAELPGFNRVKEELGDQVIMVAVHAAEMETEAAIQMFIDEENNDKTSWSDYSILFALDTAEIDCYTMLGGKTTYPMTIIINADGYITFVQQGSLSETLLRSEILAAMD